MKKAKISADQIVEALGLGADGNLNEECDWADRAVDKIRNHYDLVIPEEAMVTIAWAIRDAFCYGIEVASKTHVRFDDEGADMEEIRAAFYRLTAKWSEDGFPSHVKLDVGNLP